MTTDIGPGPLERYFALMERNDPGARPDNRRFAMRELFQGVPLDGREVLDVGAGDGRASLYAASAGARHVLALEPEAAGSSEGMQAHFDHSARELELSDRVEMQP